MPRISCWFVRASLVHLGTGALFGGLILSAKGFPPLLSWAWLLLTAHIQVMVGGWLVQLALGMAYWLLPPLDAHGDRGRPAWVWTSFAALNGGVGSAALLLLVRVWWRTPWLDALLVAAALAQMGALVVFARHAWPRIALVTSGIKRNSSTA
jgi:hypothetical protein